VTRSASNGRGGVCATSAAIQELALAPSLARRLRLLGLSTMKEYFRLVSHPDQQHERALMLDCITTNETHFFREPKHFDYLAQHVFPRWKEAAEAGTRPRAINVWSAGCSSGEEPYSLAMLLLKHLPPDQGWFPQILASDISTRVLEKARAATFSIQKATEIPRDYLCAYMLKGTRDACGEMRVTAEVQKVVRFARINLFADSYPVQDKFDLIFCRNVLIYFDERSKEKVIAGLARHLSRSGLLFVGHSEHLCGTSPQLKSVAPTVYALKNEEAQSAQNGALGKSTRLETW
jgi:chemotaxis protein methyltransferase CheR